MTTEFKMLSQVATAQDFEMEERVRRIVDLSRRRDRILEAPMLDNEALSALAADYEAVNMPCAAAELRRRLGWYRSKEMRGLEEVENN